MRKAILVAVAVGLATPALAASGPTLTQCQSGWKAEYSKMWTAAQFQKACDTLMQK